MAKEKTSLELDVILKELGSFGKYNIINYALYLFPCFLAGMYGSAYVFEAADINYRCLVQECESTNTSLWLEYAIPKEKGAYSKCYRYPSIGNSSDSSCAVDAFSTKRIKCSSYVYSDEDSAVKDFNLGCQDWKRTLIGSIRNSGLFLSLPLTGVISDRFGRKNALSIAACMNCIFGVLRSFSTSYTMMLILEFMEAGFGAGAYTTAFILAMELVGPKGRVLGNTLINVCFVCGLMTLSGLAWILQDWRIQLRVMYAPSCLILSYLWICDESIRWLLSKGRDEEAMAILKKAAKMNKVQLSEQLLASSEELEKKPKENIEPDELEVKPSVFKQVIKSRIIAKRLVTCSFLWITCTFVYYGLSINSVSLAGNKYINFMLVAFVEIPANFLCLFVLDRYGRKRVLITAYIVSAFLCISLSFIPKSYSTWALFFYLAGKFSITVAYSSVYIYVSEVFPTNVRQSLLAICSTTGRVGSTLAPLTPLLALYYDNLPAIFFGTLAIIAGFLVFTVPETINTPLPNNIEEAERLSKRRKTKNDS